MSVFSWLHFSDLHFSDLDGYDMKIAQERLGDFIKKNIHICDYVFISGDVADRGIYDEVKKNLQDILGCININYDGKEQERVFWAIGNHDIAREELRTNIIKDIRNNPNIKSAYDKVTHDRIKYNLLKTLGYDDYIAHNKELILNTNVNYDVLHEKVHRIIDLNDLNLIVLNTCLLSCDDKDYKNLFVLDNKFRNDYKKYFTNERL